MDHGVPAGFLRDELVARQARYSQSPTARMSQSPPERRRKTSEGVRWKSHRRLPTVEDSDAARRGSEADARQSVTSDASDLRKPSLALELKSGEDPACS